MAGVDISGGMAPKEVHIALWRAVDRVEELERDLAASKAVRGEAAVEIALGGGGEFALDDPTLAEIVKKQIHLEEAKTLIPVLAAKHRAAVSQSYKARAATLAATARRLELEIKEKRAEQMPLRKQILELEMAISTLEENLRLTAVAPRQLGARALQGNLVTMRERLRTDSECTLSPDEFVGAVAVLKARAAKAGGAYRSGTGEIMNPVVGEARIDYEGATGRVTNIELTKVHYASAGGRVEQYGPTYVRDEAIPVGHLVFAPPFPPPAPSPVDSSKAGQSSPPPGKLTT